MSEEIEPLLFPLQDTCSGEELQWYEDFPSMPLFPPDDGYYTASLGQVGGAGAGTSSSSRGVDVRGGLGEGIMIPSPLFVLHYVQK